MHHYPPVSFTSARKGRGRFRDYVSATQEIICIVFINCVCNQVENEFCNANIGMLKCSSFFGQRTLEYFNLQLRILRYSIWKINLDKIITRPQKADRRHMELEAKNR